MPTDLPVTPLFLGPAELMLIGLIVVVLVFGSRAPDIAQRVGETVGEFQKSKNQVEKNVEEVTEEVTEEFDDVREEVEGVKKDVEDMKKDVEEDLSVDPDASTSKNQ